jgi:DNA invertase Pin-like site-specific DNA recombinase
MALGLTIHILGSVAEHKAEMISSRAKAALVAAMARGVNLSGDKGKIGFKAMLGSKAARPGCAKPKRRSGTVTSRQLFKQ